MTSPNTITNHKRSRNAKRNISTLPTQLRRTNGSRNLFQFVELQPGVHQGVKMRGAHLRFIIIPDKAQLAVLVFVKSFPNRTCWFEQTLHVDVDFSGPDDRIVALENITPIGTGLRPFAILKRHPSPQLA